MPTIGHAAIGFAAARAQANDGKLRVTDMLLYGALSIAPDLDLLADATHHPNAVPLGHRGATHSLVAALVLTSVVALLTRGRPRLKTAAFVLLVVASHGLIDPLNTDSVGTAYFWPLSTHRLTWGHFHPIPVTPVGLAAFHGVGFHNLCTETLLFSPLLVYAFRPEWRGIGVPTGPPRGGRLRDAAASLLPWVTWRQPRMVKAAERARHARRRPAPQCGAGLPLEERRPLAGRGRAREGSGRLAP